MAEVLDPLQQKGYKRPETPLELIQNEGILLGLSRKTQKKHYRCFDWYT